MNEFGKGWESYREKVIPGDAGSTQVSETKLGFYAGAFHLFSLLMKIGDTPFNPTQMDIDEARMSAIHDEIMEFVSTAEESTEPCVVTRIPVEIPDSLPARVGCLHNTDHQASVSVTYLEDKSRYVLEVRTRCGLCGCPFRFEALDHAIMITKPCRDFSGLTASLPVAPDEGLRVHDEAEPDWPQVN